MFIMLIILDTSMPCAFAESQNSSQEKDISISLVLDPDAMINVTYSNLFKLTNNNHISGVTDKINVTSLYNLSLEGTEIKKDYFYSQINSYTSSGTGSVIFDKPGNYTLCGYIINSSNPDPCPENNMACMNISIILTSNPCNISLGLITEKNIYSNLERIDFYNTLDNESLPFVIEYWIEDIFGSIIKSKTNTTNTNQKSYTPSIEEPEKTLIIRNRLLSIACTNTGASSSEKQIAVKNNISFNPNSSISIISYPDESSFGSIIYAEISAYKGDTLKKTVYAWVQDKDENLVSEKSKTNLNSRYSDYEFNMPVQIKPNCDTKHKDGKYYLVVEGLGLSVSEPIFISGTDSSLCKVIYKEPETTDTESKNPDEETTEHRKPLEYSVFDFPEKLYAGRKFNISVNITNNENLYKNISMWAYLYIGSRCYSASREANRMSFIIKPFESVVVPLEITNNASLNKTYSFKIKINKDNQKTDYEITFQTYLWPSEKGSLSTGHVPESEPQKTQNISALQQEIQNIHGIQEDRTLSANLLPVGMFSLNLSNETYAYRSSQSSIAPKLIYVIAFLGIIGIFLIYRIRKR